MNEYVVWQPDQGSSEDAGVKATVLDPEGAACVWARHKDQTGAEYLIVGGQDVNVVVRDQAGVEHGLVVSGESVPSYRARSPSFSRDDCHG